MPGGEAPRAERRRLGVTRVAAEPADHRQPRPRRAAEGGIGVRPPDLARGARRDAPAPSGAPRGARGGRRARAGRPGPPGAGHACRRRGSAPRGPRPVVCAAESAAEVALAAWSPSGQASRRGGRLLPRRVEARPSSLPDGEPSPSRPRTCRTCGVKSARAERSKSRLRERTTSSSPGRRARARRCSRAGCPILPPLTRRGARGDADPLGGGPAASRKALLPLRPSARRTTEPRSAIVGGGPSPGPARRRSPTGGCCSSTSFPSSRARCSRLFASPSRTAWSRSRASVARVFPARFQLVGTMNMCPCGARGDPAVECCCTPQRLRRTARSCRARCSTASISRSRCHGHARWSSPRRRPRRLSPCAPACRRPRPARGHAVRAERTRRPSSCRARSSACRSRAGPRSGRAGRPNDRGARRRRARRARARRRGALVPHAGRASGRMTRCYTASRREFPRLLAAIHDPPPRLYLRGAGDAALLGRRRGRGGARLLRLRSSVARSLARELAAAGVVVVSGLARGIDGEAHRGALEAAGNRCGPRLRDRPRLPGGARRARRRIAERGLVVSEYEPGIEPAPWRFPARNRIIAGLCRRRSSSRPASGAARSSPPTSRSRRGARCSRFPARSRALSAGTNALLRLGATPSRAPTTSWSSSGLEPHAALPGRARADRRGAHGTPSRRRADRRRARAWRPASIRAKGRRR